MKTNHLLERACILTFIVTTLTSIPLLFNYVNRTAPKFQLIVDLHVWFGMAFIIFVSIRIIKNRKFVKSMLKGGN